MPTKCQMQIMQHLTQPESGDTAELSELLKISPLTSCRKLREMEKNVCSCAPIVLRNCPLPLDTNIITNTQSLC